MTIKDKKILRKKRLTIKQKQREIQKISQSINAGMSKRYLFDMLLKAYDTNS